MPEQVQGLSQVTRKLTAFDSESKRMVKELNLAAASEIAVLAGAKAPIGDSAYDEHPGQLCLSVKASSTGLAGYVTAGGKDIPYAAPIHWGWPGHNIAADPFIREAALEGEPSVVRQYRFGLDALLHRTGLQ